MEVIHLQEENLDSIKVILKECFNATAEYEGNKIHLGITDVVAYVGLLPFELEIENKKYKAVGVCSLATLSEFRGNGYGSKLIKECIKWSEINDIDFIILYGESDFYSRFGFDEIPNLYEKNNAMIYIVNNDCVFEKIFNKETIKIWENMPKF